MAGFPSVAPLLIDSGKPPRSRGEIVAAGVSVAGAGLAPQAGRSTIAREGVMAKRAAKSKDTENRYWSSEVTRRSNALDLEAGVFTLDDPAEIAHSLARSAEASARRKSTPFRSAMSMLTFYINRAGKDLPEARRRVLEDAKEELRKLYGRERR